MRLNYSTVMSSMSEIQRAELLEWDVVVVGSGIGGGTIFRILSEKGLRVLCLEKGGPVDAGHRTEAASDPDARLAAGYWPWPAVRRGADDRRSLIYGTIGCAIGGTSIHYAAALERLEHTDFDALDELGRGRWPVTYDEFRPYYERAERLYGLGPESRALAEARASEWDRALVASLRSRGLRPEYLQVGMRYDEQCLECAGWVCPRKCKADARVVGVEPALAQPTAMLVGNCEVLRLAVTDRRVQTVVAKVGGRQVEYKGRAVVLACGAFHTPKLLLTSGNGEHPNGLANRSDQVGRNLMFHTADMYAIWAPRRLGRTARQKKAISVRDFYSLNGERLGYIQSMGVELGAGAIAIYLKEQLRRRGVASELLLKLLVKLPAEVASLFVDSASLFVGMTEDDPEPHNRIFLDPTSADGISFHYEVTEDLAQRAARLREQFAQSLRPWRMFRLPGELQPNYGHPCGTCRFGNDPATSVLDRNCRAHDIDNLYVADSSFMPRSGATNPSLTIAANAIRVGDAVAAALAVQ